MAEETHQERLQEKRERRERPLEKYEYQQLGMEEREKRKQECIVITGAASGIGKECLKFFARDGYYCVGVDLNFDNEEDFKRSLSLETKDNLMLQNCDVTKFDLFRTIIEKLETKFGYIHCLINCAGIKCGHLIDKQDMNEWTKMFHVNVMGVLNGIRCVVEKMKENKNGVIINIGDVADVKTFKNHAVYCATKCAVRGITEGIRCELAEHHVKVVGINPGAVDTPSFVCSQDKETEKLSTQWKDSLKHGLLLPQDVARCCLFAYQQPKRCLIREIQLAPIDQKK
jgi:NADP-dependent 3-hydroxy acid dehydrogenase YdfG